ncbi:hypothetical protein DL98DRAFT_604307 [Cadophora sp. DSE1049]|nr:hypothetical protein DL98DRAFT_604307 [Cadophora sp. DSE1049]
MATSFLGFARLPYELQHIVWVNALPSATSEHTKHYIKCLAYLILAQPRDTFFGYGVPTKYDGTIINDFIRNNPSPYADLNACPESRVVALKHVKKLLHRDKDLGSWLANPKFPYTDPELIVHQEGILVYRCQRISDGFDLERYIFWEVKRKEKAKRPGTRFTTNDEYERWREEPDLKAMKQQQEPEEAKNRGEGEREFWEDDETFTNIGGAESLPWDDDSDTEDNDVPPPMLEPSDQKSSQAATRFAQLQRNLM